MKTFISAIILMVAFSAFAQTKYKGVFISPSGSNYLSLLTTSNATATVLTVSNVVYSTKRFSTNYTAATNDLVLFCVGTNQIITLPSPTNLTIPVGKVICIIAATNNGSVSVTNANGVALIMGGLVVSVPATNSLTVISDGKNWW